MSKKKRKKAKALENTSALSRWAARNSKWFRRAGISAGLIAVVVALFIVADPLGGGFTAIDANGEEVKAGVIDGAPGARARTGSPAPNFLLPDYDKLAVTLAEYQGKTVFVNFWASWCGPCAEEMPDIVRIAEKYPDDLVVLAVNRGESRGQAQGWTQSLRLPEDLPNFNWILDGRESVTREYGVDGMPQSFVIDSGGSVFAELRGATDYNEISALVEPLIASSASSTGD